MKTLTQEYFRAARLHLSFAKKFKRLGDLKHMRISFEWAQQDHYAARKILREARA